MNCNMLPLSIAARRLGTYPPPGGDTTATGTPTVGPCDNSVDECSVGEAKTIVTRILVAILRERDFQTLTGRSVFEPLPAVIRLLGATLRALDDTTTCCRIRLTTAESYFHQAVRLYLTGGDREHVRVVTG